MQVYSVMIGPESGNVQMPGHDAVDLHGNRGAEGNKFEGIQAGAVGANHRQINVRVGGGIAWAWKMLSRRQAAIFLHAAHELAHKLVHALSAFAPCSRI